jgi:hypothetical protein
MKTAHEMQKTAKSIFKIDILRLLSNVYVYPLPINWLLFFIPYSFHLQNIVQYRYLNKRKIMYFTFYFFQNTESKYIWTSFYLFPLLMTATIYIFFFLDAKHKRNIYITKEIIKERFKYHMLKIFIFISRKPINKCRCYFTYAHIRSNRGTLNDATWFYSSLWRVYSILLSFIILLLSLTLLNVYSKFRRKR